MATSVSAMPSHLHFPPELWSITIQNFRHRKSSEDLTFLWTVVRCVSRQFKDEVEEIFRTEHLPKTWLHVDLATMYRIIPMSTLRTGTTTSDFASRLNFDQVQARYPGRAVFSLPSKLRRSSFWRKIFDALRDHLGPGILGEADSSVSGSRTRLVECPASIFVVQVRGVLGDCALPLLNINRRRYQLSLGWKALFNRIFGERKLATAILDGAPVDQPPSSTTELPPALQSPVISQEFIDRLAPSLKALAEHDWHTHHRHMLEAYDGAARTQRLLRPIQTWIDTMGDELGHGKMNLRRCRLRRQADRATNLDEEGAIDQANIDQERERNETARSQGNAEWFPLTEACDTCRTGNRQCLRDPGNGDLRGCDNCVESGSPCDSFLAFLNSLRPHYVMTNFRMQQILAAQRTKASICAAGQQLDTRNQSSSQSSSAATVSLGDARQDYQMQLMLLGDARRDYQMQLMLLEQQNKARLRTVRLNQGTGGLSSSLSSHAGHPGLNVPLGSLISQSWKMNSLLLEQQNRELLLLAKQPPVNNRPMTSSSQPMSSATLLQNDASRGDGAGSSAPRMPPEHGLIESAPATISRRPGSTPSSSQQLQSNLAPLLVHKEEEARDDQDYVIGQLQLQPQLPKAREPLASMPTRMAASPMQTENESHPADASQSETGF